MGLDGVELMMDGEETFDALGFAIVEDVVPETSRRALLAVFASIGARAGRRDGMDHDAVRALATSERVRELVGAILGEHAFGVRATLFDKTPGRNWPVAWHQDVTVPVRERRDVEGYSAWSSKGGVPHVRPPVRVLESMLAVRVDVDGTTAGNGPLRVVPGTHRLGVLGASEVRDAWRSRSAVECHVPVGGVLVMRPLLLHASSRARDTRHRRVVHLEFATGELPGGLEWHARGRRRPPSSVSKKGEFRR